jgi:hypothetical protein
VKRHHKDDINIYLFKRTPYYQVALSWKEQNPELWKLKKPVWDVTNWSRLFWLRSSKRGKFFLKKKLELSLLTTLLVKKKKKA